MNVERLTLRSRRHLSRVTADLQQADRLHGRQREAALRGAARQFMQAGFHDLAKNARQQARKVRK